MAKRRRQRRRGGPTADDVLTGKVSLDAAELIDLIHRVNPTDLGLPPAEQAARYRTKSALQSLLIRQAGEFLEAVPEGDEGVVSLRHRFTERDAAHAVVAELDDDARSWIRAQLDGVGLGVELGPPAVTGSTRASPADALSAGMRARRTYEWEEARQLLTEAFEGSRGDVRAARALLELLVDDLAAWQEAGDLVARLGEQARSDPEVRGLLCEAAGRRGDFDECRRWSRDSAVGRCVQGLSAAAETAVAAGDLERADELVGTADALAAAPSAELTAARLRLAAARADADRRAEEEILRRLEGLADSDVVRSLADFVAGHPHAARARRSQEEARRRLAAQSAERRARLGAVQASRRTAAVLDRLERLVDGQQWHEALTALGELPGPTRAAFAGEADHIFDWFVRLSELHRRAPAAERIDATVALRMAEAMLAEGDGQRAEAELMPHQRLLEVLPEAAGVIDRARAAAAESRRAAAHQALAQAVRALQDGRASEAALLLRGVPLRDLDQEERSQLEGLREAVGPALHAEGAVSRARGALDAVQGLLIDDCASDPSRVPELLDVVVAAEAAAAAVPAPEAGRWREQARRLRTSILHHGRCRDLTHGFGQDLRGLSLRPEAGLTIVRQAGRDVHLWAVGDLLLRFDHLSGEARAGRLPRSSPGWSISPHPDIETQFLVTDGQWLATVDGDSLGLEAWRELPSSFDQATVDVSLAQGRYLWAVDEQEAPGIAGGVRVLDTERGTLRTLDARASGLGGDEQQDLVVALDPANRGTLWTGAGEPSDRYASDIWQCSVAEATLPAGTDRLMLLLNPTGAKRTRVEERYGVAFDDAAVLVGLLTPSGDLELLAPLSGTADMSSLSGALDPTGRWILVDVTFEDGTRKLRACSAENLDKLWSCSLPPDIDFVVHSRADHGDLCLRVRAERGIVELPLHQAGPPELPPLATTPVGWLPGLSVGLRVECGPAGLRLDPIAVADVRRNRPDALMTWAKKKLERLGPRVDDLLGHALIMFDAGQRASGEYIVKELHARFPEHRSVRAVRAGLAANEGDWPAVLSALGSPREFGSTEHLFHLHAVALAHLGRFDEAHASVQPAARSAMGSCPLIELERLVEPLPERPEHLVSALRSAVKEADRALDAGDPAAALEVLDLQWVRRTGEVQVLARLVEATLTNAGERPLSVAAELNIATWLSALARPDRVELPYPEGVWSAERLDGLAVRARRARG